MKKELVCEQKTKVIDLNENQVMSFKKLQKIFVASGKLWITVAGDEKDYFYGEGEIVCLPKGKHTVIQSLGKSTFWL